MKSPCIKVCVIDEKSGLCSGCLRTLDEIARWSRLTDDQREEIMRLIKYRTVSKRPDNSINTADA